jgi:capsular exopolysaccharide synthesis family protein
MEPTDVLRAVRARWLLLVAGLVLGLAGGYAVTQAMTPQYTSTSRLFVSAAAPDATGAYTASLLSEGRIASYSEILTSQELATRVIGDLRLDLTPAELDKKISVATVPATVILDVTVTDTSPTRARRIAVAVDTAFVGQVASLETAPGATTSPIKVTVLQPPQVNRSAISPNVPEILGIGAAIGLLAGFLLALVRHRMDHTVKTGQDVARAAGTDLLGIVRRDKRLKGHAVAIDDERSPNAEAFRAIRVNLQHLDVARRPKVIVVSSPGSREGKTTLALNLAAVLGRGGTRVLLIEADLRQPTMARRLDLAGPGLAEVLSGDVQPADAIRPWRDGSVHVLVAGATEAHPSDLLASARMAELVEEVRDSYDFVLIDTPPVLTATDATVVSVLADACLVAARHGSTRREELAEAVAMLTRLHVPILGVVLNGVPRRAARDHRNGFASAASALRPAGATVASSIEPGEPSGTTARRAEGAVVPISEADRERRRA